MSDVDKLRGVDTEAAMTVGDLVELEVGSGKQIMRSLKPKEPGSDNSRRRRGQEAVRGALKAARRDVRNDAADLAAMTHEAAMSVELPDGATHRLIGGSAAGKYVKILKFEYREGMIFVELVGVSREANKMHVPASFLALGNNDFPDSRLAEELKKGPESPYDVVAGPDVVVVARGVVARSVAVYFTPAGRRKSAKPKEVKPVPAGEVKVVKPRVLVEPKVVSKPALSKEEIVAAWVEPLMEGLAKIINDEDYNNQKVKILGTAKDNPEMIWVEFVGGSRPGRRTQIFYRNLVRA